MNLDKLVHFEIQFSHRPFDGEGKQRTYRNNSTVNIITTDIGRAIGLVNLRHQMEEVEIHSVQRRSSQKLIVDPELLKP